MTINELIKKTKKYDSDISEIKIAIQNKNDLDILGNAKEVYFGELEDMPHKYLDLDIDEKSTICASSDKKRNGANVLLISM